MTRRIIWVLFLVGVVQFPGLSHGQQPAGLSLETAHAFIDKLGQRTLGVLQSRDLPAPQRGAELGRILLEGIDFDIVSMHTLGRYGRKPEGQEFREFSTLFSAYIIDLAIEKFGALPIRSYTIAEARLLPNGDVMVNTSVAPDGADALNTGWRVRNTPGGPKIIDITVDGYSMVTHFSNQFSDWLSKAGLAGLVAKLRGQTKNSPSLVLVRNMRG
ncbi:MAG: MlaC/ttg2D family ABC transporter substrate-binding protein [Rhodospirillales bacterium]